MQSERPPACCRHRLLARPSWLPVTLSLLVPAAPCRYGFVRYQDAAEAQSAINALDGTSVLGHTLQVKFADADAGPPTSGAPSGLTPSDSCYVKHLPATYGVRPRVRP